jgi:hypothetical protein
MRINDPINIKKKAELEPEVQSDDSEEFNNNAVT